jgi:hypothetical protein
MSKAPRPLHGPLAYRWEASECGDPNCGVHIYAYDGADACMAEIIISANYLPTMIKELQGIAYSKAVEKDE